MLRLFCTAYRLQPIVYRLVWSTVQVHEPARAGLQPHVTVISLYIYLQRVLSFSLSFLIFRFLYSGLPILQSYSNMCNAIVQLLGLSKSVTITPNSKPACS